MKNTTIWMTPFCFLSVACAPPEAPQELQKLADFIYAHTDDEDDEVLRVALENLSAWLDEEHEEDIQDGYQIDLLRQSSVGDLPGSNHKLNQDDLVGAAVAHNTSHSLDQIVHATTVENWQEIVQNQYEYYNRTFTDGKTCIRNPAEDCFWAEARSESELVQLGVSIISKNRIQYRWVELEEDGYAFIQRSWLTEPPEVSSAVVDPRSQYFLAVTLPKKKPVRVQATWIDTKIVGVSVPKNQVVKTMREQGDLVEEWMDENY